MEHSAYFNQFPEEGSRVGLGDGTDVAGYYKVVLQLEGGVDGLLAGKLQSSGLLALVFSWSVSLLRPQVSLSGSDRHPMQLKAQSSNLILYFSEPPPYPMRVTSLLTATYYYGFFSYTWRPGVARN